MGKVKVPVLMYHEISSERCEQPESYKMTPAYNISDVLFEEQVKYLSETGYQGVTFADISNIDHQVGNGKYIILTFDDGWIGNHTLALPILNKYNFKAVFFVTGDFVGRPDFMDWKHLEELVDYGMLVQSHAMTHKPLQNMKSIDLHNELSEPKKLIERKLGIDVFSMSFPHGSYDHTVIKKGSSLGYNIMCTSNLKKTYIDDFLSTPSIIGRITMTSSMPKDKFIKLINYDKFTFAKYSLLKNFKNAIRSAIGIDNYRKLYRLYYNISTPEDI